MDESEFWTIVEGSKAEADGTFDGHAESLAARLSALTPEKIVAFRRVFDTLRIRSYSWDLWGAAYVIHGGCSDDGFADFQSWLISMGRNTFERALSDPDSLADVELGPEGEEEASFEEFAYIAAQVYEDKTGNELPADPATAYPDEPGGEPWEEDNDALAERYPRLFAKYGDG
jgi:hypothetical protein